MILETDPVYREHPIDIYLKEAAISASFFFCVSIVR
jgi:hypothetical protein